MCTCLHVFTVCYNNHVCRCPNMYVHEYGGQRWVVFIYHAPILFILKTESLTELETCWLTSQASHEICGSAYLHPTELKLQPRLNSWLSHGCWGSERRSLCLQGKHLPHTHQGSKAPHFTFLLNFYFCLSLLCGISLCHFTGDCYSSLILSKTNRGDVGTTPAQAFKAWRRTANF